ncbi:MAG: (R)-2-hydroxyacid dehydrogenase [Devosia sp.]|uniref:Ldh family oxidoreductase n=1 Tax=Devosia sp. TaxID=1871048 RepID=UPI00261E1408|nr:Ldh family oxidoreductase [Devosia sp.]MDB5585661.1 (R)-2-hydroxyacid dehydrogenase [Devosia sp.]
MPVLAAAKIRQTAECALVMAGVPAPSAAVQVDLWLDAELRGVPSHGLLRLERIVQRIEAGLADPHATGIHTWQGSSYLTVEGQNGLGPIVANAALAQIQERARHSGIAIAAVANAQHIGMLAWYAERVAREGQAAIVLSTRARLQHLADSPIQQQQYVRS